MCNHRGNQPGEHPRGVFEAERQHLVEIRPPEKGEAEQTAGILVDRNVEVRILQVYRRCPVLGRKLREDDTERLHPETLRGNEKIDQLEVQNDTKIPGTLGDNKNRRQAQRLEVVYLHDRLL